MVKLLSKPANLDYNKKKTYEQFRFFRLALTERNWSGKEYITKEDCSWFMEQLKELDDVFYNLFGDILSTTRFDFLMDTSVFAGKLPENLKIIEFLEELDDFYDYDFKNEEKAKIANKYLNKLKSFKNKTENITYIYRWALSNPEHPFATEIKEASIKEVEKIGRAAKDIWTKDMLKIKEQQRKLEKKGVSLKDLEKRMQSETARMVTDCEKRDTAFLSRIIKYGLDEPTLFFYAVYFIVIYYKQMEGTMGQGYEFISFERKGNNIELYLRDSTERLDNEFLQHETFISTLPKVKRREDGRVLVYSSLYDITNYTFDNEEQIKGVFKTIANLIIQRIPHDVNIKIPNKRWIHPIRGDFFASLQLENMYFEDISMIGGPKGPELLIKVHVFMSNKMTNGELLFPIFDPTSWENLNATQCAVITYALCLLHDISIEQNYELVKQNVYTFREEPFDYLLVTLEKSMVSSSVSSIKTVSIQETQEKERKRNRDEGSKKTEHWVSFHFRRLKTGHNASEKQKAVAAEKYGIKELPPGFTFVDTHVRGEQHVKIGKIHFSALEILNKTLSKLHHYYEEQEITV